MTAFGGVALSLWAAFVRCTVQRVRRFLGVTGVWVVCLLLMFPDQVVPGVLLDFIVVERVDVLRVVMAILMIISLCETVFPMPVRRGKARSFMVNAGLIGWLLIVPHRGFLDFVLSGVVFLVAVGLVELTVRSWRIQAALARLA